MLHPIRTAALLAPLLLAAAWWQLPQAARAGEAAPKTPGKPPPGYYHNVYRLDCAPLSRAPADRQGDCDVAAIALKKAFFDAAAHGPTMVRVTTHVPQGQEFPILRTEVLGYRRARPLPREKKGTYEWTYHGFILWSARASAAAAPFAAGWADADTGRRFKGGAIGGYEPYRLRSLILRSVAATLTDRVNAVLGGSPGPLPEGGPPPTPLPPLSVTRKGKPAGVCKKLFGSDASLEMLDEMAEGFARAVTAHPNLKGASGPWQATLFTCPKGAPVLSLRLRSKRLSGTARCVMKVPLTLSRPAGLAAQCFLGIATELEHQLVGQWEKIPRP